MDIREGSQRRSTVVTAESTVPAYFHFISQVLWIDWVCLRLKVANIKVGECVIDEAMHGSIRAVHILVDKPWNEVRRERNHKCLGTEKGLLHFIENCIFFLQLFVFY